MNWLSIIKIFTENIFDHIKIILHLSIKDNITWYTIILFSIKYYPLTKGIRPEMVLKIHRIINVYLFIRSKLKQDYYCK